MSENAADWRFETKQIHSGAAPDPVTNARATPIYQTTSYVFDNADHAQNLFALAEFGNIYTRIQNPTQAVVEERLAALEGGTGALLVASRPGGRDASPCSTSPQAGDHIVSSSSIYGGTYNLFKYTLAKLGIETTFVENQDDAEEWRARRPPEHEAVLRRDDRQPEDQHPRHRARRRRRARERHPADRRQHDRDAVPHPPVRVRRRHRRALGHEVPRRPRHGHRRRHRRRRHVRVVEERRQVPRPHRARPVVPRRELHGRGRRRPRLHHQGPRAAAARPRRGDRAAQRVAAHPGHRDAVAAHRASRAERAGDRGVAREPPRRRLGELLGPATSSPWYAAANKYAPKGVGAVLSFELKGGVEAGRAFVDNARRCSATSPTSATCARSSSTPRRRRTRSSRPSSSSRPASRRASCASRSGSRTSTTSRPTSRPASPPRAPSRRPPASDAADDRRMPRAARARGIRASQRSVTA